MKKIKELFDRESTWVTICLVLFLTVLIIGALSFGANNEAHATAPSPIFWKYLSSYLETLQAESLKVGTLWLSDANADGKLDSAHIPIVSVADSANKVDTTATGLVTYVGNHGGATLADVNAYIDSTTLDTIMYADSATYSDTAGYTLNVSQDRTVGGVLSLTGLFDHFNYPNTIDPSEVFATRPDSAIILFEHGTRYDVVVDAWANSHQYEDTIRFSAASGEDTVVVWTSPSSGTTREMAVDSMVAYINAKGWSASVRAPDGWHTVDNWIYATKESDSSYAVVSIDNSGFVLLADADHTESRTYAGLGATPWGRTDTGNAMHVHRFYFPAGFPTNSDVRYNEWIAYTPLNSGANYEDICVAVWNHDSNYYCPPYIDTGGGNLARLINPVLRVADFPGMSNGSDPWLLSGKDGYLNIIARMNNADSAILVAVRTIDGYNYTDTTRLPITRYVVDGIDPFPNTEYYLDAISPFGFVGDSGNYVIGFTTNIREAQTGVDSIRIVAVETPSLTDPVFSPFRAPDTVKLGGFKEDDNTDSLMFGVLNWVPPSGYSWHCSIKPLSPECLVLLTSTSVNPRYLYCAISNDGGMTWSTPDTLFAPSKYIDSNYYTSDIIFKTEDGKLYGDLISTGNTNGSGFWGAWKHRLLFGSEWLKEKEWLIPFPANFTDTMPFWELDSLRYPEGIVIINASLLTSVDGAYNLKMFSYTSADPPVLHDYIDTLITGASDQFFSSSTFENLDAQTLDAGQRLYFLTDTPDIDWIRVKIRYYIKESN